MKKVLLICLLLSSCGGIPQKRENLRTECDKVIAAEEARYRLYQQQLAECEETLKNENPTLFTKGIYAVAGLILGLVVGVKISGH